MMASAARARQVSSANGSAEVESLGPLAATEAKGGVEGRVLLLQTQTHEP